ncbi:MAG TPA: NAD(P)H-dependent oxidoreductase [Solirubrobacteraceae bacterium]|jgi:chromate reductase|nr:NAD(P)H-dependent oxidoreductase [Solirubrobacteraceae bacterium]
MTKVLAISGSLRRSSYNGGLLQAAAEHAPEGVEIEIVDDLEMLAPYNEDRENDRPDSAEALMARIAEADALLISTPEFNTTMPGQLKHLIDWGSRPYGPGAALYGKPVAVVGASSTDYGAMWAQDHVRKALGIAGARVADTELSVARAQDKFDARGTLTDEETLEQLEHVLRGLAEHHRALAHAA